MKTIKQKNELQKIYNDFQEATHDALMTCGDISFNEAEELICLAFTTQMAKIISTLVEQQGE